MGRLVMVELHDDKDFNYVLQLINDEIALYGEAREVKNEVCAEGVPLESIRGFGDSD